MSGPKVMIVNNSNEADHRVFLVQSDSEQRNHQILLGGRLVTSWPDLKVMLVGSSNEADIRISRRNFPKK
jgi:hypothetical protein